MSVTGFSTMKRDASQLANTFMLTNLENASDSEFEYEAGWRFGLERRHADIIYSMQSRLFQSPVTLPSGILDVSYHLGLCTAHLGELVPSAEVHDIDICLDRSPLLTRKDTNVSLIHSNIHSMARQMIASELDPQTVHSVARLQQQWRIKNISRKLFRC